MAQHVGVDRVDLLEVGRSRRDGQRHDLHDPLPVGRVGGSVDDAHIRNGIGPVGTRVGQMRPVRVLPVAVRRVRGEEAELAVQNTT